MVPQQKILRIFKLIRLLHQRPGRTVTQLAALLETSQRSVYRYLNLLEEVGYLIDKDLHERYFLFEPKKKKSTTAFEPEEALLLKELIPLAAATHPLRDSILHKLYLHLDYIPLAENILNVHVAKVVSQLSEAIRERRQVQLLNYHSTNSETYDDRMVEPDSYFNPYYDGYNCLYASALLHVSILVFWIQIKLLITSKIFIPICLPYYKCHYTFVEEGRRTRPRVSHPLLWSTISALIKTKTICVQK